MLESLRECLRLKVEDFKGLKADIKTVRKTLDAGLRKESQVPAVTDLEGVHRLHSAVDFQNGFMILGFRVHLPSGEEGLVLVISDGQGVRAEVSPESVDLNGITYQLQMNSAPPFLDTVWALDRLKVFLKGPTRPQSIYQELKATLRQYLDLPEAVYGLLAAWGVATFFAHQFAAFPFLHFQGPKECGKSKTLEAPCGTSVLMPGRVGTSPWRPWGTRRTICGAPPSLIRRRDWAGEKKAPWWGCWPIPIRKLAASGEWWT